MRVSTQEDDAGFKNFHSCYHYHITVDGEVVKQVLTVDEELGYVLKAVEPVQADLNDNIVTEELNGVVKIIKIERN